LSLKRAVPGDEAPERIGGGEGFEEVGEVG